MVENVCVTVSNYATETLQDTLNFYGKEGFSLVSAQMASDKYGSQVMYLFFVRHTGANGKTQAVNAVPVSELEKLRDYLYAEDLIFMRGLAELNKLIAKYDTKIDDEVSE